MQKRKQRGIISNKSSFQKESREQKSSWKTLTFDQRKKCKEKFESCKPNGSSIISKNELQRMFRQIGKQITEEELLEMIHEVDQKGDGYITFETFQGIIEEEKIKRYEEVTSFVGLTYDSILQQQRIRLDNQRLDEISWQYLKYYLLQNFGININTKSFVSSPVSGKHLSRDEFMNIFS